MTKQTLALRILTTLYRSASRGHFVTVSRLADLVGRDSPEVDELLTSLDRAGFVDYAQLRLTLAGLAVAAAAAKKPSARALARAA